MHFGEFNNNDVYHIETSDVYRKKLETNGISTVEFILYRGNNKIAFVEAKHSFPNLESVEKTNDELIKICNKFAHAIEIHFSTVLNRLSDDNNDMPDFFKTADYGNLQLQCFHVINGSHDNRTLSCISEKLRKMLNVKLKIWGIKPLDVIAINHNQAKKWGLIYTVPCGGCIGKSDNIPSRCIYLDKKHEDSNDLLECNLCDRQVFRGCKKQAPRQQQLISN